MYCFCGILGEDASHNDSPSQSEQSCGRISNIRKSLVRGMQARPATQTSKVMNSSVLSSMPSPTRWRWSSKGSYGSCAYSSIQPHKSSRRLPSFPVPRLGHQSRSPKVGNQPSPTPKAKEKANPHSSLLCSNLLALSFRALDWDTGEQHPL